MDLIAHVEPSPGEGRRLDLSIVPALGPAVAGVVGITMSV